MVISLPPSRPLDQQRVVFAQSMPRANEPAEPDAVPISTGRHPGR